MIAAVKRDALARMMQMMLEHCAQCARRGPSGEWVLLLDEPRHDFKAGATPEQTHAAAMQGAEFLGDLARASGAAGLPPPVVNVEVANLRPVDPAWLDRCDQLAEDVARELKAYTVLVAVQELGKMAITAGGEDLPGEEIAAIKEIAQDMPAFLHSLAETCEVASRHGKHAKAEPELHFMPGCFDSFEGTQEQLEEFKAQLHQMFASGEIQRDARPLSSEEVEQLQAEMRERAHKRGPLQ